jgi:glycosyltransferase involved in cell wall biosynthesis
VARRHPDAVLVQAGRAGTSTARVTETIARCGLQERVLLLGRRPDVPDLLSAADAFVFTSSYEGLGGAVVEAMAMQTPVAAFAIPPVVESTGGAAVLVPPGDAARLGSALADLLDDPDSRVRLASAARDRFESTYAMPVVMDRMVAMYRRVADGSVGVGQRAAAVDRPAQRGR